MTEKVKIVVSNKNTPRGVVNIFGNIKNKVGVYDRKRLEQFRERLLEKTMEYGEKVLFIFDDIDDAVVKVTDKFFDKIIDTFDNYKKEDSSLENKNNSSAIVNNDDMYFDDCEETMLIGDIVPKGKFNFEDLEPLGRVIDDEEDINGLKELKMELLSSDYIEQLSKNSDVVRKK